MLKKSAIYNVAVLFRPLSKFSMTSLLDPIGSLDILGILCMFVCMYVCLTHFSDSTLYIPSLQHQTRLNQVNPSKPK